MSWEQAVQYYIDNVDNPTEIKNCYFDLPLLQAAQRFYQSSEWQAVQALLGEERGKVLEVGAGRGIAAYALVVDGWQVTALEPDNSELVGNKAIRKLSESSGYPMDVVAEWGESLPFLDNKFDLVYGRAVLHHAQSLEKLCQEVSRVLKPGGKFLFVREHVISKPEDKDYFLSNHPLHQYYGGENAYLLKDYVHSLTCAGLKINKVINPFESDINIFPHSRQEIKHRIAAKLKLPVSGLIPDFVLTLLGKIDSSPGRLYAFYGLKK